MTTIRAYTTIEQSRKLAEILSLESADMQWFLEEDYGIVQIKEELQDWGGDCTIPCWSLAALLNVLPNYQLQTQDDGIGILCSCNGNFNIVTADNPVDACVAMIERLHELKML